MTTSEFLCLYAHGSFVHVAFSKHRNNLINLQSNVGREAFNEGAEILPSMGMPTFDKRQSESLQDEEDIYWAGNISIGTPGQTFLIDFDSEPISGLLSFKYRLMCHTSRLI